MYFSQFSSKFLGFFFPILHIPRKVLQFSTDSPTLLFLFSSLCCKSPTEDKVLEKAAFCADRERSEETCSLFKANRIRTRRCRFKAEFHDVVRSSSQHIILLGLTNTPREFFPYYGSVNVELELDFSYMTCRIAWKRVSKGEYVLTIRTSHKPMNWIDLPGPYKYLESLHLQTAC